MNFTFDSRGTTTPITSSPATLILLGFFLNLRAFAQRMGVDFMVPTATKHLL